MVYTQYIYIGICYTPLHIMYVYVLYLYVMYTGVAVAPLCACKQAAALRQELSRRGKEVEELQAHVKRLATTADILASEVRVRRPIAP